LSLLFVNYFVLYAHRFLVNYIQVPLQEDLGLSELQLNATTWAFHVTYALAQLFVGYLSDRFSRRTVLISALAASTIAFSAMGLAQGFYDMFALRVALAATQAASVPAIAGIMADCFVQQNRSRAVSIYLLSSPFSLIVAGAAGGALAENFGWRVSIACFGAGGFVVVCVIALLLREPERTERAEKKGLGVEGASLSRTLLTVLSVRSFLLLALAYLMASNVSQQLAYFLPRYFSERFGMDLQESGAMATIAPQIGTVIGLLSGGALADLLARRWPGGRFVVQIGGLCLAIPAIYLISFTDSTSVILCALFVSGIGFWLYFSNLWTTTFDVVDPAARSTAIGLLNVAAGVFGSWPYLVVGKLRDDGVITDLRTVFFTFACVLIASAVILLIIVQVTLRKDLQSPVNESLSE
jgi:sugar phosphate permease